MTKLSIFILVLIAVFGGNEARRDHDSSSLNSASNAKQSMLSNNDTPKQRQAPGQICQECQDVLQKLKVYLGDIHNVEKLEQWLKNNFCDRFFGQLKNMCDGYAENLLVLVHYMNTHVFQDPMQTCRNYGLCTTGQRAKMHSRTALVFAKHLVSDGSGQASCEDCKLLVAELHSLLEDKAISDEVKAGVERMCNYLPGQEYQRLCREYVDSYWADILKYIQGMLADSEMVCQELGMCPTRQLRLPLQWPRFKSSMPAHLAQHVRDDDSAGCIGCKVPIDFLINFMRLDNTSRNGLVRVVQDVCLLLPSDIDLQCFDFIGIYGPPSVLLTLQTLNGSMVCQFFKACKKNSRLQKFYAQQQLQRQPTAPNGFIECETCRHLMQWIGGEMKNPDFQDDAIKFVQQLCQRFARQDKCQQMINVDEIRGILTLFGDELRIAHFCRKMHICPPQQ